MSRHGHLVHVPSYHDNPIVFITSCTHHRRAVLAQAECHDILREIWEPSSSRDGWWIGHYILMPDHVQFFARPKFDGTPMARWVQMWKSVSSRRIASALGISTPVWQAEYFDRYLRSSESYSEKWDCVQQNAVRPGLVMRAEDWPYHGVIHDLML